MPCLTASFPPTILETEPEGRSPQDDGALEGVGPEELGIGGAAVLMGGGGVGAWINNNNNQMSI